MRSCDRVESHVTGVERQSATEVELATRADADLTVAERLAQELGSHVNRAAQLRSDLVHSTRSRQRVARPSDRLAQRARTESTPNGVSCSPRGQRCPTGSMHSSTPRRSLRQLAERCRDKIANAPSLANPISSRSWRLAGHDRVAGHAVASGAGRDVADRRQGAALGGSHRRGSSSVPAAARRPRRPPRTCCSRSATRPTPTASARIAELEPMYRRAEEVVVGGAVRPGGGTTTRRRLCRRGQRQDHDSCVTGGSRLVKCTQPGCTGTVVDGYCDVCGLAPARFVAGRAPR